MSMRILLPFIFLAIAASAQKVSTAELVNMARTRAPGLEQALRGSLGQDDLQKGTAAAGEMGEFVFAIASEKGPALQINYDAPIPAFKAGAL